MNRLCEVDGKRLAVKGTTRCRVHTPPGAHQPTRAPGGGGGVKRFWRDRGWWVEALCWISAVNGAARLVAWAVGA